MAETKVGNKKLPTKQKPTKIFEDPNGVVGLGILAALTDDHHHHHHHHHHQDQVFINGSNRGAVFAFSPKPSSNPIPILSLHNLSKVDSVKNLSVEKMEMCEEYTCVISHVGDNLIKKREYFEANILGDDDGVQKVLVVNGNGDGELPNFGVADFLNSCFLCQKMLHGLDIFMYRGDKAFCSSECRYTQISMDEQKERKPMKYSVSPCSGTVQFLAGAVAA